MDLYKPVVPDWVAEILQKQKDQHPFATLGNTRRWSDWKYRYSRKLKYARLNGWIKESDHNGK